jgi:hypothetical protein
MGGVLQDTHLAFIVLFSEDRTDQIILELYSSAHECVAW